MVDNDTRLIAITLVSNINGFLADSKALSELAHAHNAYLYADVAQAAGCIPMDVRTLGLDFCCAGGYKWLMGLEGLGFLYVKEELQGEVLRPMQFGDRQYDDIQYHNFPGSPAGSADVTWELKPGAARYEIGTFPNCGRSSARNAYQNRLSANAQRSSFISPRFSAVRIKSSNPSSSSADSTERTRAATVSDSAPNFRSISASLDSHGAVRT